MSAPAEYRCQVPGCEAWGVFGHRRKSGNWRDGYVWWCSAHRHLMPTAQPVQPPERRPAPKPTGPAQGRFL